VTARIRSIAARLLTWDTVLAVTFLGASATSIIVASIEPGLIGSHAVVYTDAARAWLAGGDPWSVGPPMVVYAGPPPMLLLYAPFTLLPPEVVRYGWVALDAILAAVALSRLGVPLYWLAFPPLAEAIVLGHPEVVVLALLVLGGSILSGLAAVVKVYAGLPLLAERRWRAVALATAVILVTVPILPWGRFVAELPMIQASLARQNVGDSTFGDPILMVIGVVSLAVLGRRRALWLAVPVLWPYAQPEYKIMTLPILPPLVAFFWAIPVPGLTLLGVTIWAALLLTRMRVRIPDRIARAIEPAARLRPGGALPPFATAGLAPRS
jgi:hypothetical protein